MKTAPARAELGHHLIELPAGRCASDVVVERHDMVLLFDATKANPNGDPDTGNMPRIQPDTLKGLVTDVCLKRKIRNVFSLYAPDGSLRGAAAAPGYATPGYEVFIRENAVLQAQMESADVAACAKEIFQNEYHLTESDWNQRGKLRKPRLQKVQSAARVTRETESRDIEDCWQRAYRDALCRTFFDVRFFGGVMSTEGPLKGSFYGQIRGPLQFTFAESLDRVLQLDATITRMAVASEKEQGANEIPRETPRVTTGETSSETDRVRSSPRRTMGRKHLLNYGLFRAHIYFSPAFAAKTGFTYADLDNFLFALSVMFRDDAAAGRAGMRVVGLVDFQHASSLGNEHAHKLFDLVQVERTADSRQRDYPNSLADYQGTAPQGIVRKVRHGKEERATVTATRFIWDIPAAAPSS